MRADVVIVGAGFAGAATAWHLARRGVDGVVVIEREAIPGAHASGRNAAMVRQVVADPFVAEASREGAAFWSDPPEGLCERPPLRETGSLLVGGDETIARLAGAAGRAFARLIGRDDAMRVADALRGAPFAAAIDTPTDGVADVHAMLSALLRDARARGVRVLFDCEARWLETRRFRVAALVTTRGRIATRAVVDASGAWAGLLARSAGGKPPPFAPMRRHLFVASGMGVPAPSPFVWDIDAGVYARPEGEAWLLSACDEDAHPPCEPATDPSAAVALATKVETRLPALRHLAVERSWACLRTFAPDRRFVIGADPFIDGYHYAAGLGGHGVTCAAAVGRLAADALLAPESAPLAFRPSRFTWCG